MILRVAPVMLLSAMFAMLLGAACKEETKLTITGVDPKRGLVLGGEPVTIQGTGFQTKGTPGFTVYFGKKKATGCIIASNTAIRCAAPAGLEGEKVDVEIQFDDTRRGVLKQAFEYYIPTGPGGADAIAPTK